MTATSLLLLSSLLAAPLVATDTAQPTSSAVQVQATDLSAAPIASGQHLQLLTPEQKALFAAKPDDICYKIRAYIFKRDDDHAPELAGSTTCGPRQPRAQNALWPKARLVPAD